MFRFNRLTGQAELGKAGTRPLPHMQQDAWRKSNHLHFEVLKLRQPVFQGLSLIIGSFRILTLALFRRLGLTKIFDCYCSFLFLI